jgi:hypothetical protein
MVGAFPEEPWEGGCTFWSDGEISVDNSLRPLRGRGGTAKGWVRVAHFARRKQPLTPGFTAPSCLGPLGEGRY